MTQFSNIHDLIRPKPFALRRYSESPRLWLGVLSGSVALHLLLLVAALPLILRLLQPLSTNQTGTDINPIEIVDLPSNQDNVQDEAQNQPGLTALPQPLESLAPVNPAIPNDSSAVAPQPPSVIDFGNPDFDPAIAALPGQEPEFTPSPIERSPVEQPSLEQPPIDQPPLERSPVQPFPEASTPGPIQAPILESPVLPPQAPAPENPDPVTEPTTPPSGSNGDSSDPNLIALPPLAENPDNWNPDSGAIAPPNPDDANALPEQGVEKQPRTASYQISLNTSQPTGTTDVPTQPATPVSTNAPFTYNPLDRSGQFGQCSINGDISSDLGRSVTLRVTIDENGQVVSSEAAEANSGSVSEAYRQLTACLVQGWQFNAALMEGNPIWSNLEVSVQVNLQ